MIGSDRVRKPCRLRELIRLTVNLSAALRSVSLAIFANWAIWIFRKVGERIMRVEFASA